MKQLTDEQMKTASLTELDDHLTRATILARQYSKSDSPYFQGQFKNWQTYKGKLRAELAYRGENIK